MDTFDSKGRPVQGILLEGDSGPASDVAGAKGGPELAATSGFYKVTNFCEEYNLKKDLQPRIGPKGRLEWTHDSTLDISQLVQFTCDS